MNRALRKVIRPVVDHRESPEQPVHQRSIIRPASILYRPVVIVISNRDYM